MLSSCPIFYVLQLGNLRKAARFTRDLLQHDPYHERALSNEKYFNQVASEEPDKFIDGEEDIEEDVHPEYVKYEKLCRKPQPIVS